MMESILKVENLDVGYKDKVVISNIHIDAKRGDMICILGPNGAGKSTILRTLSAMLKPINGKVYLQGVDIESLPKPEVSKKMAVVLTERLQPGLMTGYEIVAMGRHPYTGFFGKLKEEDHKIIRDSIKAVNAQSLSDRYFNEFSDGEKQKIMIARALTQEPEIIILDEPTSHLDIKHRVEVVEILSKLCRDKGITVIMALHDIDLALKGCQNIIMVKDGKVVASGMPENIVGEGVIEDLYDISNASYSDLVGNLELPGEKLARVFLVGGGGSSIPFLRGLRRLGLGVDSGVLYKSDIDYHISKSISNKNIVEEDFSEISDEKYQEAYAIMLEKDYIIDSGFSVGDINFRNIELLKAALEMDKKVLSIRKDRDVFRDCKLKPTFFNSSYDLLDYLRGEENE